MHVMLAQVTHQTTASYRQHNEFIDTMNIDMNGPHSFIYMPSRNLLDSIHANQMSGVRHAMTSILRRQGATVSGRAGICRVGTVTVPDDRCALTNLAKQSRVIFHMSLALRPLTSL